MDIYQIVMSNRPDWSHRETIWLTVILLAALILSAVLCKTGKIKLLQAVCGMLLLVWLLLVLGSTVLTRFPGKRTMKLELFWSWREAYRRIRIPFLRPDERYGLLVEILLNMVLLLPAGLLLPLTLNRRVHVLIGLLFGLLFSSGIEVAQLLTCRGFFEFDDIFGNTLGCTVGCILSNRMFFSRKENIYAIQKDDFLI